MITDRDYVPRPWDENWPQGGPFLNCQRNVSSRIKKSGLSVTILKNRNNLILRYFKNARLSKYLITSGSAILTLFFVFTLMSIEFNVYRTHLCCYVGFCFSPYLNNSIDFNEWSVMRFVSILRVTIDFVVVVSVSQIKSVIQLIT